MLFRSLTPSARARTLGERQDTAMLAPVVRSSALQPELPAQVNLQRITQHGSRRDAAKGGGASRGARARPLLARPFSSSCAGHRCSSRPQEDRTVPRHAQAWGSAAGATASTDAGGVASWSESRSIPLENHGLLRFRHRSVRWIGLWGVLQSTPAAPLPLSLLLYHPCTRQIGRAHV